MPAWGSWGIADGLASGGAAGSGERAAGVAGQQRFEGVHGLGSGQVFEQEVQVRAGLDSVGARGGHEGVEIGAGPGTVRTVREEPDAPSLTQGADEVLDVIVVSGHVCVLEMARQLRSLLGGVGKRLAKDALRGHAPQEVIDPAFERCERGGESFPPELEDLIRIQGAADT